MRKLLVVCGIVLCCFFCASARGIVPPSKSAQVRGKVVDAAGAAVSSAAVTLTDLSTNTANHATTRSDGTFDFSGVSAGPYIISIEKSGFESYSERLSPATQNNITATLQVAKLNDSVVVRGTVNPEATPVPSREDVLLMPQTVRVLDRKQLDAAGPVAGGAQMLQYTPGANVMGYGQTGATKYTVILNGLQQGWAGEATSFIGAGSLDITYDGIPVVDPATGLWQSATMPQNLVIQDVQVNYGPGPADGRWYTDVGGRVEFTPVQPTEERHLSVAATQGPDNQQNFAFVGNTGHFKGWSTVLGGGLGRADDFREAPDGFGNHTRNGSVFGKTVRTASAGSFTFGVLYAKGGGYRPTVIPTADVQLIDPVSGIHFSQPGCGFYCALPYASYNKYDTNEMFMTYARQRMYFSPTSTLENSAWYTHIRRFHRRNQDALAQGSQVDEWNNPHSNMFGDQIRFTQVLPYNTVSFGGYLISEVYNSHNLFYNPIDGGSGSQQIVGVGSKFRSGYFQQDNVTFFAQDDVHPIARIHIIPSVRVDGFSTNYSDQAQRDITFAPNTYFTQNSDGTVSPSAGPVYETHCALYPQGQTPNEDPFNNVFGTPVNSSDGNAAKDQGSLCGAHESRSAVEPGIDASVMPKDWLMIYGGYDVIYRSPALGGGGGQFQAVNPTYYTLAKAAYGQFGGKIHFTNAPVLRNFIAGVSYFHNDYTNQEIDFETANGVEETGGGDSTYHGVDAFFDADPSSNLHFFFNFSGEATNFTKYIQGGPSLAECAAQKLTCVSYANIPVSYVPDITLNTGVYYGIQYHDRTILEPRFWVESTGKQYIWSNNGILNSGIAGPTKTSMPSYTIANLSFNAPVVFKKQSFNLRLDLLNVGNTQYNEFEYISSGQYFAALAPDPTNLPNGYINAYPGAPRMIYGTITYQF
ncbi:MAG TPA: TonB-dependent receptor [Edaphobacter sp.]|uniref:TonB-dependent receptor n=1 Tax=Edaphobacter sp. TaxID=1934404 RepID=UPI002B9C86F6|nr:TonB-dependent receptor [Edaphobacter sp.]HUZ94662.1 TonB-dependent receptor [Edaphobacter sp.]